MNNPFIGQMDRKIDIVWVTKTKSTAGGVSETETVIASPFAQMKEVSGNEDPEGKIRHIVDRKYIIRYNSEVYGKSTELRVKDGNNTFNVYHVKELDGRRRHLEILVTQNG